MYIQNRIAIITRFFSIKKLEFGILLNDFYVLHDILK